MGEMSKKLLAANVRAVMCISDGSCAATYNLRPNSKGTLLTNGDACPDIGDVLRADLGAQ